MSEGDVKPDVKGQKLQLVVMYEGRTVKFAVRSTQKLEKVFKAAADAFKMDQRSIKFLYNGTRLRGEETPEELEMEDLDQIDAHLEQIGGGRIEML